MSTKITGNAKLQKQPIQQMELTFSERPDLPRWMMVAMINIASATNACNKQEQKAFHTSVNDIINTATLLGERGHWAFQKSQVHTHPICSFKHTHTNM